MLAPYDLVSEIGSFAYGDNLLDVNRRGAYLIASGIVDAPRFATPG
jgi:hypothetical protein